ncbi:MAG: hypothetical protein JWQ10_2758 [Herbaspirillum sp.]|nr:hypothetical protein [Herbaspirillum sp.]
MGSCMAGSESRTAPELQQRTTPCPSFQDAVIDVVDVPYDPTRHGMHEILPMHGRDSCQIKSQWGASLAHAKGDLITITRGGKTYLMQLDRPIRDPLYRMDLSPDGCTCVALTEDETSGGGEAQLYIWRLDDFGRETIRSVPMPGPVMDTTGITVTDNGAVFLRARPAEGWEHTLLHWQPDAALCRVWLPFNFHSIAAVAPNGTRLLLDGFIEKTQCVFLVAINPVDSKRQYDYCILKKIAPQTYLNHSHGCFSPDSEVLAMDEKFDDNVATGKWTLLFVNVSEAVSNGSEINLNNPAIARRSPVITARSGYYAFATGPSFLSDGMTVVKTLLSKNSAGRYAQEVRFPFAPALPSDGGAITDPVKSR